MRPQEKLRDKSFYSKQSGMKNCLNKQDHQSTCSHVVEVTLHFLLNLHFKRSSAALNQVNAALNQLKNVDDEGESRVHRRRRRLNVPKKKTNQITIRRRQSNITVTYSCFIKTPKVKWRRWKITEPVDGNGDDDGNDETYHATKQDDEKRNARKQHLFIYSLDSIHFSSSITRSLGTGRTEKGEKMKTWKRWPSDVTLRCFALPGSWCQRSNKGKKPQNQEKKNCTRWIRIPANGEQ